jgi:FdhE protein
MLRILIDAAEGLQDSDQALPDIAPGAVSGKWARGLPALRGEAIPIPASLTQRLPALCDALMAGGAGDSARHIKDALTKGEIDAGSLLRVSLARNQSAIRTSSLHHGFAPDLVWLIGELASAPLAHFYQTRLLSTPSLQAGVRAWDRGYCPCCGSWPALIEMTSGPGRVLRCSYCAAAWELQTRRCVYCGNADERFLAAAPDVKKQERRIELCGSCGSYTKVLEVDRPTPFPLLAIDDLATLDLDQAAMGHEYSRPSLFDLDAIDAPQGGCSAQA